MLGDKETNMTALSRGSWGREGEHMGEQALVVPVCPKRLWGSKSGRMNRIDPVYYKKVSFFAFFSLQDLPKYLINA